MEPYYLDAACSIFQGDSLAVLPTFEPDSVDGILTDPPYGLGFMGKAWDHGVPSPEFWREALRVAKPGAYLLAFGGTRTFHRLACAIEDPPRPLIRGGVAGLDSG
jgi:site-specific DNA-methyltransferase (adenine-specific)